MNGPGIHRAPGRPEPLAPMLLSLAACLGVVVGAVIVYAILLVG